MIPKPRFLDSLPSPLVLAADAPRQSDDPRLVDTLAMRARFGADAVVWTGTGDVTSPPAIGARIVVHMNGFGPSTVTRYVEWAGFLGVECRPDKLPAWYMKQSPDAARSGLIIVYGPEIRGA